ncbi:hypothetical protein Pla123a_48390 [Posidoniimonas polymericola]|uniref:Sel1 repeat protein n=1 Tax=Posidoniimonas polymericola TaxID=2528002 RepID=A0A5C5XTC3_9BACT|nr:sel1 repeat family protein [Posidoniimonas polymericola]TWT65928.1 hypothetical protein Pla123a_48390 [Posidoniimonas polymericola]
MPTRPHSYARFARLVRKARGGHGYAANNIAAECRILGRPELAYRWWVRAAANGDGDHLLEVAYCLHHQLGVRREVAAARHAYRLAIDSPSITPYSREEACYHLATLLLRHVPGSRNDAIFLLIQANADKDYPQAGALLDVLLAGGAPRRFCCCRRWLAVDLGRADRCPVHRQTRAFCRYRRPTPSARHPKRV